MTRDTTTGRLARRGLDELDFLGTRADATPLLAATVRAHVQGLRTQALTHKEERGRTAHDLGTMLVTLYMRHGDAVLGFETFRQFILHIWPETEDEAYGSMIIARHCTADQAEAHGYSKCLFGIRLAQRLGLESFAALEEHDFGVDEQGSPLTLQSLTATRVKELATAAALVSPAEPERVGRTVLRLRKRSKELQAARPAYRTLKVKVFAVAGEPAVNVTAVGRDGGETARKFLAELWK